jgi:hypothetical protein
MTTNAGWAPILWVTQFSAVESWRRVREDRLIQDRAGRGCDQC